LYSFTKVLLFTYFIFFHKSFSLVPIVSSEFSIVSPPNTLISLHFYISYDNCSPIPNSILRFFNCIYWEGLFLLFSNFSDNFSLIPNNIFKFFNCLYLQKYYFLISQYFEKLSSLHNSIFGSFDNIYSDNISFRIFFNIFISYWLLFPILSSNPWMGISNYHLVFFYFYYVDLSFFLQPLISCFTLVVLLTFSLSLSISHPIFPVISILFYFQNSFSISNCTTM